MLILLGQVMDHRSSRMQGCKQAGWGVTGTGLGHWVETGMYLPVFQAQHHHLLQQPQLLLQRGGLAWQPWLQLQQLEGPQRMREPL
jgi:hypothetical protein